MKKFFIFLFLIIVGIAAVQQFQPELLAGAKNIFAYSPCSQPMTYKIGNVDPRFNLSQAEFEQTTEQAAEIWNDMYGSPLFVYAREGELTVNLVYDKRQLLDQQVESIENDVKQKKESLEVRIAEYERQVAVFNQRLADLNSRIDYWNSQGGAPPEEYDGLVQQQQEMRQEAQRLNAMAEELNLSTQSYNLDIGKLKQAVDTYNAALRVKPEEGIYDGRTNTITVYFGDNKQELLHTLAHEFGHALGLPHIENPTSLMYPYTTEIIIASADDRAALLEICRERSIVEVIQEQIALFRQSQQVR